MTDKLFTLKHFESQDWAYDNNKPIHTKEMVDLLNELHEEKEYWKYQAERRFERIMELEEMIE